MSADVLGSLTLAVVGEVAAVLVGILGVAFVEEPILAGFERAGHFVLTGFLHVADSFFAGVV